MSTRTFLKQVEHLQSFEKLLVQYYFAVNHLNNAPQIIMDLCILYCFVLDEFMEYQSSTDIWFSNLGNTAISLINNSSFGLTICRNIISLHNNCGKYHWAFKLLIDDLHQSAATITFGFIDNYNNFDAVKLFQPSNTWNPRTDLFHVYLDLDDKFIVYVQQNDINYFDLKQLKSYSIAGNCLRIGVSLYETQETIVELVEYNNSHWYKHQILKNINDAQAYVDYAQCTYDISEKITYYSMALGIKHINSWNNELLKNLSITQTEYNILSNISVRLTFTEKPLGLTLYRGEDELNAWVADIQEDVSSKYEVNGLKVGYYIHCVNDEVVDNQNYYEILNLIRSRKAPMSLTFNTFPPLNKNYECVKSLMVYGLSWSTLTCAWYELNQSERNITYNHPQFMEKMLVIISKHNLMDVPMLPNQNKVIESNDNIVNNQFIDVCFEDLPLGIDIECDRRMKKAIVIGVNDSLRLNKNVNVGMFIYAVNGVNVESVQFDDLIGILQTLRLPIKITFSTEN